MESVIEERVQYWLQANFDDATKKQIQNLLKTDQKALVDAFYANLSFGTGGLRGIMGVGPNRMNSYTVGWATQGLANYLKKQYGHTVELRVAIGYDSRNNSKAFAEEAAKVLAANDIRVFLFKDLRPTPLVSFACRYHKCHSAIMVTASHNPPLYNGYKVYWNDGAQVLPPHDIGIIEEVNRLHDPDDIKKLSEMDSRVVMMGKEVDDAYLEAILPLKIGQDTSLRILYSSLHGTGITLMPQAFAQYGFQNVSTVEKQCIPDGNFPTCKRPNPEEKEALELGIEQMLKEGHDIFIATDPDADRVGVVVRHNNEAVILNGNQIACIGAYFICLKKRLVKNAAFVKTIVTTELFRQIVEEHGARCFDVLTGFKYIAEKIREWEETKSYEYVFGGEESYGYLLGTHVRDKDAIVASCLLAEAASWAKEENKTLVDVLEDIYSQYGFYSEKLQSLDFEESREGRQAMQKRMYEFRNNPPIALAGEKVVSTTDLLNPGPLPKSDVLIWELASGTKIIIRPSGTEPKIKIYLLLKEPKGFASLSDAEAKAKIKEKSIIKSLI